VTRASDPRRANVSAAAGATAPAGAQAAAAATGADPRPIGVFDSGIGGLTVLRRLWERLPNESLVYFGDTARLPYGTKSPETVQRFSIENTMFLLKRGVKMVVVACHTSSAVALPLLKKRFDVPVVGVVEGGARAAVARTRSGRIGVIGTRATIRSGAFEEAIHGIARDMEVVSRACPLFVPIVEEGWSETAVARTVAEEYVGPLMKARVDTVILGCTHYPLLAGTLGEVFGRDVALIDPAEEAAAQVSAMIAEGRPGASVGPARHAFYLSDVPATFEEVGKRFLGRDLGPVERIEQTDLPWFER